MFNESLYRKATEDEARFYQLKVLSAVSEFCKKNDIKWFLYYGSLLGAIRHKGFIPWDDDIDIAMLREDYDKFLKLFSDEKIKVYEQSGISDYPFYFAKICDSETLLIEDLGSKGYNYGIGIDLFPLDNIPDDPKLKKKMIRAINWRKNIRNLKTIVLNKKRNIIKTVIIRLGNFLLSGVSVKSVIKGLKKVSKKYASYESSNVADIMFPYGDRSIVKTVWFNDTVEVDFEDIKMPVPVDYDKILTQIYGDYMTPPPEAKRASTHFFNAYVKK